MARYRFNEWRGGPRMISDEELGKVGDLLMAGCNDQEIADAMGISQTKVGTRIQILFGIHNIVPGNRVRLALALYRKAIFEDSQWKKGTPNADG